MDPAINVTWVFLSQMNKDKMKCIRIIISNEILNDINTMLCPIKVNSNTIELTVHTSCYWVKTYSVLKIKPIRNYASYYF